MTIAVFVLLLLGAVPIALVLGLTAMVYIQVSGNGVLFDSYPQQLFGAIESYGLLAIPLFMLAGELMNEGGVTRRLIELARLLVGGFRGGLAYINLVANMMMAAIVGSAASQIAIMSRAMVPAMEKEGYDKSYSAAITAAGGAALADHPPLHALRAVRGDGPGAHRRDVHRRHPAEAAAGLQLLPGHRPGGAGQAVPEGQLAEPRRGEAGAGDGAAGALHPADHHRRHPAGAGHAHGVRGTRLAGRPAAGALPLRRPALRPAAGGAQAHRGECGARDHADRRRRGLRLGDRLRAAAADGRGLDRRADHRPLPVPAAADRRAAAGGDDHRRHRRADPGGADPAAHRHPAVRHQPLPVRGGGLPDPGAGPAHPAGGGGALHRLVDDRRLAHAHLPLAGALPAGEPCHSGAAGLAALADHRPDRPLTGDPETRTGPIGARSRFSGVAHTSSRFSSFALRRSRITARMISARTPRVRAGQIST